MAKKTTIKEAQGAMEKVSNWAKVYLQRKVTAADKSGTVDKVKEYEIEKAGRLLANIKAIEQLINKLPFNSVEQALEYINELEKEKKQQSIFKPQNPI